MSRAGKSDEFYTQLSTIEDELRHYREYFEGQERFFAMQTTRQFAYIK
jgi:hypothetical protein